MWLTTSCARGRPSPHRPTDRLRDDERDDRSGQSRHRRRESSNGSSAVPHPQSGDDRDAGRDRGHRVRRRRAVVEQAGDDRHEEAHAHDRVEDAERIDDARGNERDTDGEAARDDGRDARDAKHLRIVRPPD